MIVQYIDFHTAKLTMTEVIADVAKLQALHPGQEIYMDGDLYSIVGRSRETKPATIIAAELKRSIETVPVIGQYISNRSGEYKAMLEAVA